jgi:hypothetical protein
LAVRDGGARCGVLGVIVDFVVVGFGLGALVLLIGLAVRDLAPRLSRQSASENPVQPDASPADPRHFALAKNAPAVWGRACHSLGQVIMIGGGAIVVATVIGIVGQFTDESGARLVLAAALLALGAIVLRAGQIGNNIYGADRRARARSHAAAVSHPLDGGGDRVVPGAQAEVPVSVTEAEDPAAVSANGAEPSSTTSNGGVPPLPDLQTLLGERRGADHYRRDEIVTLEQFLGLAPEPAAPAPAAESGAPSVHDSSASSETPVEAQPGNEPAAVASSDGAHVGPVESSANIRDGDLLALAARDEPSEPDEESPEPQVLDQATQTGPDEAEETTESEERSATADEKAETERAGTATETVAQTS